MFYLLIQTLFWNVLCFVLGLILGTRWRGRRPVSATMTATSAPPATIDPVPAAVDPALVQARDDLQRRLDDCSRRLAEARARASNGTTTPAAPDPAPARITIPIERQEHDDLQRIYGIGPYNERKLNELNITRYEQIATLTEADIERIGAYLNFFPDRIRREGWMEHARRLHREKYGVDVVG